MSKNRSGIDAVYGCLWVLINIFILFIVLLVKHPNYVEILIGLCAILALTTNFVCLIGHARLLDSEYNFKQWERAAGHHSDEKNHSADLARSLIEQRVLNEGLITQITMLQSRVNSLGSNGTPAGVVKSKRMKKTNLLRKITLSNEKVHNA